MARGLRLISVQYLPRAPATKLSLAVDVRKRVRKDREQVHSACPGFFVYHEPVTGTLGTIF